MTLTVWAAGWITNLADSDHMPHSVASENARLIHYENMPIQIYWKFYHQKMKKNQIKIYDILHISAQNIDCEYALEPPRRTHNLCFLAEIREIMYTL